MDTPALNFVDPSLTRTLPRAAGATGNPATAPRTTAQTRADAVRVGREFEQMFLSQMLGQMFSGMRTDGMFGGGFGEEMFRSLQVDEYARGLVRNGGVGIATAVTRELIRLQEGSHG